MRLSQFAGLFGGISLPLKPGICCIGESMEELLEIANGGGFKPKPEAGDDMSGVHDQRGLPISDDRTKAQEGASVFNASSNPVGGHSASFAGKQNRNPEFRTERGDGSRRGETGSDTAISGDPPASKRPGYGANWPASA
jgi:hypothetical protein